MARLLVAALIVHAVCSSSLFAQEEKKEPIFSGPQKGEKLPPLKVKGVFGDEGGKTFDYVQLAGEKPTVIVFMHKLTRPSAAVMRTLLNYTGKMKTDKIFSAMVFLTADATDGEKRLKRAAVVFKNRGNSRVGISTDGAEGPGAYGLNRNMTLTILVANKGKVTANFALVQPSVQADVMKVVKEIVKLTGDEMPKLDDLFQDRYAGKRKKKKAGGRGLDPQLAGLLRSLIQKDNTKEDVAAAIKRLDAYFKKNPKSREHVGTIARRIIDAGRLESYGTKPAQDYLKKCAKDFKAVEPKRNKE